VTQTNVTTRPGVETITAASIEQTSRAQGEPEWLTRQRLAAWSLAEALPLPTRFTEGWRRIDLGGLDEAAAKTMIVNGFFEAFTKELPMEYAVELNRLLQLQMEGAIG